MESNLLKVIAIILGLISISMAIDLFPDRSNRSLIALTKSYPFEKTLEVSEKFTTDFESYYEISFNLEHKEKYKVVDSTIPYKIEVELWKNNKPIEKNEENAFLSEYNQEYELKIKLINASSNPNTLNVGIQTNVPGPTYELLIEREYEWILWIISAILMLIAFICGYFGFRKKPIAKTKELPSN